MLCKKLLTEFKKKATEVCEIQNILPDHVTQESDTNQSQGTDQIEGSTKNLLRDTNNDQIQLNSIEFNRNQWMSVEINEHQLNSVKFNGNQLILTDINRF